jgi:hypothetical protein
VHVAEFRDALIERYLMSLVRRALFTSVVVCGALFAASPMAIAQGNKNCSDFTYQEEAQAVYNADPTDPNGLDADKDGIACESLPHRPASTPTATRTTTATPKPAPTTTKKPTGSQVKVKPAGGVATGGGDTPSDSGVFIALGGVVLVGAAAGTVLVARRRAGR